MVAAATAAVAVAQADGTSYQEVLREGLTAAVAAVLAETVLRRAQEKALGCLRFRGGMKPHTEDMQAAVAAAALSDGGQAPPAVQAAQAAAAMEGRVITEGMTAQAVRQANQEPQTLAAAVAAVVQVVTPTVVICLTGSIRVEPEEAA